MKRIFSALVTVLVLTNILFILVTATSFIDIETSQIPDSRKTQILSNIQVELLTTDNMKASIKCFALNQNGFIAIGLDASPQKLVYVFNVDGVFQYGYRFSCDGKFGVGWDGDNIIVYFIRGDIAATFDQAAQCIEMVQLDNSAVNNRYFNQEVFAAERISQGNTYYLKSDMGIFTTSYAQLVMVDNKGTEKIIYDAETNDKFALFIIFTLLIIFAVLLNRVVKTYISNQRKTNR